jgi:hypothetical protein
MKRFGGVNIMHRTSCWLVALATTLAFLFGFWVQCLHAGVHVDLPLELEGELKGAPYRIMVPENWNGTLLVYARGTGQSFTIDGKVGLSPLVNVVGVDPGVSNELAEEVQSKLLSQGYALAASAYSDPGFWVVQEGISDTLALTLFFRHRVGKPDRTIIWSRSQGTLVALKSVEKFQGIYDGVIAGCAVGAGAPRTWDSAVDFALAYDVAFKDVGGWLDSWGSVGDVCDYIEFETDVAPVLLWNLSDPGHPENFGRFEFMRLVNKLPRLGFYPWDDDAGFQGFCWLFADMYFATEVRADLEQSAGGPVGQNIDHSYSLTDGDKAYLLNSLGVDAESLLDEMNARTNIEASKRARIYLRRFADFSGKISCPVLTMHTTGDGLVIPSHESAYRKTVEEVGRSDKLVQVFVDAVGHCTFTPAQWLAAVAAIEYWLDTGEAPNDDFFPEDNGFNNEFTPQPWPQPPELQ